MSVRCRTIKGESTSDSAGGIASSVLLYSLARSPTFVFRASVSCLIFWLFFVPGRYYRWRTGSTGRYWFRLGFAPVVPLLVPG